MKGRPAPSLTARGGPSVFQAVSGGSQDCLGSHCYSGAASFSDGDIRRELFPLPHISLGQPPPNPSQHQRRKAARHRKVVYQSNAIIDTLNSMYAPGFSHVAEESGSQRAAQRSIYKQVQEVGSHIPMYSEREASQELLHSCLSYAGEEASTTVRPFNRSLVSIPEVGAMAPHLSAVLDPYGREILQDPDANLFVSGDEWGQIIERGQNIEPYMDEVFRNSTSTYIEFVKDLWDRGMVSFTDRPRSTITPFFVAKKDGRLRLVLDFRAVNQMFRSPPPLAMSAGFSWSRLKVPQEQTLYTAQTDVKDYFYSLRLPHYLRPFFALPPIPAHLLKLWGVSDEMGGSCEVDGMTFPQFGVVPMGWNWAMFFAQRVHQCQALLASGLGPSRLVAEGQPAPQLDSGEPCLMVYADNLNVIGTDRDKVQKVKDDIQQHLQQLGFRVHEVIDASTRVDSLGFAIDGKSGKVLPIPERVSKVIAAFKWLSRRPKASGRMVEKLLGHAVHFMLLRREMLSIFRSSYDFVQASYHRPTRLWRSVAKEAEWAANLLHICCADLKREWSETVTASDASLSGIAVCARGAAKEQISELGSIPESWRFRSKHALNPRESVFRTELADRVDPFSNIDSVKPIQLNVSAYEDPYELNPDFKDIPQEFMDDNHWGLRFAAFMGRPEPITVLESRGTVAAVRHLLRSVDNFGKRFLHLNDNLANVLCSEKGRSGSFAMLRGCRRLCALVLAADIAVFHRWVPSEFNPADHGSRRWESWRVGSQCEQETSCKTTKIPKVAVSRGFTTGREGAIQTASGIPHPLQVYDQGQGSQDDSWSQSGRERCQEGKVHELSRATALSGPNVSGTTSGFSLSSPGLCQEASGVSQLCEEQSVESRHGPELRRELQHLSQLLVSRRARHHRRVQALRGNARRMPKLVTEIPAAQVSQMPSRLAEVGSWQHTATTALCTGSIDSRQDVSFPTSGSSSSSSHPVCGLPASRGSPGPTSNRCDQAMSVFKNRCDQPSPLKPGRVLKGRPCRRIHQFGQRRTSFFRQHSGETGKEACQLMAVQHGLSTDDNLGQHNSKFGDFSQAVCDVPVETRWPIPRQATQLQDRLGGEDERQMVSRLLSSAIRKACADQCRVPSTSSGSSGGQPESRKIPQKYGPKVFKPPTGVKPRNKWIVEVFSGCARLSQACAAVGFYALALDIEYGSNCDLLRPGVEAFLFNFLSTHDVALVWFGLPCSSWSRARKHDGGPPPLRDDDALLWGKHGLSQKDQFKVVQGNKLLYVTLRIVAHCLQLLIPWIIENPWTSRVWLTPLMRSLEEHVAVKHQVDYCQYNAPWRKSTALLAYRMPALNSVLKTCAPTAGRCSLSKRQHIILQGTDSKGTFLTLHAQPYPLSLCQAIASLL